MIKEQVSDEKRRSGYTDKEKAEIIKKRKKALDATFYEHFRTVPMTYKVVEYK